MIKIDFLMNCYDKLKKYGNIFAVISHIFHILLLKTKPIHVERPSRFMSITALAHSTTILTLLVPVSQVVYPQIGIYSILYSNLCIPLEQYYQLLVKRYEIWLASVLHS